MSSEDRSRRPEVGLFVTCLVDFFRPSVGLATVRLLERAGCRVQVPLAQVCCGQPAWNNGAAAAACRIARQVVDLFAGFEYVVVPSGSCAAMLRIEYPRVLAGDPAYRARAEGLAGRTWELTAFLVDVLGAGSVAGSFNGTVTFHDGCSGLRDLGVRGQPRRLLSSLPGLELKEMPDPEACCGFGGTFCVKFPEVSEAMVSQRVSSAAAAAPVLTGCELGCLLNIAGRLRREDRSLRVLHVAELLAGDTGVPGIGEPQP